MLSLAEVHQARRRRRPSPSLKQQYHEYILRRIEAFKNSIPRDELLRLGDEAVSELQATADSQFILTEVLMLDSVDRMIMKRLSLRPFKRWCKDFQRLRAAQREPTHWGVEPACPIAPLLHRLEPDDTVLVFGARAEPLVYLLAAHEAAVTFLGTDLASVERVESCLNDESLAVQDAFVVQPGLWLPPIVAPLDLIVIDPAPLAQLNPAMQCSLVHQFQELTRTGGVHLLLGGSRSLAPEALLSLYEGWERQADEATGRKRNQRRGGLVLGKPASCQADTESEALEDAG
ncbi:MAG TPA: hypothetical protein VFL95_05250 [Gemmatimonadales bacterium]|nr:hypothetical protein [Gemmatimonadales bacterium]